MNMIRLNKFLADSGLSSRRKADEIISTGQIKVNGEIVSELGSKIDPVNDKVEYLGKVIGSKAELVYYALYKPKGIVSTSIDEHNRKSVVDLVPKNPRVFPVGRLDIDSEGLMILTNDGDLANLLTHPKFEHKKEYEVIIRITNKGLSVKGDREIHIKDMLEKGLMIDQQLMKADTAEVTQIRDSLFLIRIVLHTGFNRQIRKMCAKIGLEVIKLTRIRISKLSLSNIDIKGGEYKQVLKKQII